MITASYSCRIVFISSASAYQKPLASPWITEGTPLHNPYWEYSRNKAACEQLLREAYDREQFDENGDEIELRDEDEDEVVYTADDPDYVHEEEFVTNPDEVLESGYNYDEEQDEDTFSTFLQEVVAESEAQASRDEEE